MPAETLDELSRSYLDLRWHLDPVEASSAGLAAHDARLGRFGAEDVRRHVAACRSLMHAVEEYAPDDLEEEIDRTALLNEIRFTVHRFETERPQERDPGFWLSHLLEGVHVLLVVSDRSEAARAAALAERLGAVPAFLSAARDALGPPARPLAELAASMAQGGRRLVIDAAAALPPANDPTFPDIVREALGALEEFEGFVDGVADESADDGFAIGEEAFNFRLAHQHALRHTATEIARMGRRFVDAAEGELDAAAAEIAPGAPWPDVLDRLRAEHRITGDPVASYRDAMDRARRFVEERDLAPVPPGELEVLPTPSFLEPLVPFAAYQPPGAFATEGRGRFFVTAAEGPDTEHGRRALRSHCAPEIATIALHEGYPGHHLQFLVAHAHPQPLRRVLATPVTVEGWALYCEEMMAEEGFFRSPEERFFQKLALLWRALRVVIDVGLHTGVLSFDDAVQMLADGVHFDPETIRAEVRRYCAHPSYQIGYAVGCRELMTLRDDYRARAGTDYSLRAFHAAVLGYGGYPVSLARWGMGL